MRGKVFIILFFAVFISQYLKAQCIVTATSSNGWTATLSYQPISISADKPCSWGYHYYIGMSYTVTFTGSTTGRSISYNMYLSCNSNTGSCSPYVSFGTFTGNSVGTATTNNSCYISNTTGTAGYYGSSVPDCNSISLSYASCTSGHIDMWGSGVSNTTTYCYGISSPLPIELLSYHAELIDNSSVLLKWSTATEVNNDFFTIERSKDGVEFEQVGIIKGAGNSTIVKEYSFIDENPYMRTSYYRLKQTDYNGDFKYFPLMAIENGNTITKSGMNNLHPNPTTNYIEFTYGSSQAGTLLIQLFDNVGRLVINEKRTISVGSTKINVDTKDLIEGVYILKATLLETASSSTSKLVKN